jgi:hypothetical protein
MKAEHHTCSRAIVPPPPESKVARCAQLCASHWVQGSPLPPAAQAIISLRHFHRHFLDRGKVRRY